MKGFVGHWVQASYIKATVYARTSMLSVQVRSRSGSLTRNLTKPGSLEIGSLSSLNQYVYYYSTVGQ